jgi:hypothetical protein
MSRAVITSGFAFSLNDSKLAVRACGCRDPIFELIRSLWVLGVWHRGRIGYWRLLLTALVRRPRQLPKAMELAIMGYLFRRVVREL